ncbi:MAG TPA: hypothetical protein VHP30_13965 [Ignavibacteriales bacterium]|nr:hypothetical protein [Ignavibacteriales bacterium]
MKIIFHIQIIIALSLGCLASDSYAQDRMWPSRGNRFVEKASGILRPGESFQYSSFTIYFSHVRYDDRRPENLAGAYNAQISIFIIEHSDGKAFYIDLNTNIGQSSYKLGKGYLKLEELRFYNENNYEAILTVKEPYSGST